MEDVKELYADSVQFSYTPAQQLLTGAYLKCRVGDVVGLLGRNGCGKSTLMKIIFGALKAQHSYIMINGKRTGRPFLTKKIGYLPQHSFVPTYEKVSNLIHLMVGEQQATDSLLNDIRIRDLKDKKVYQLSAGELRYLEICLLIAQPTDFLLLDEPFSGLEPLYTEYIAELIVSFKDKKGFVISDHQYNNVLDIATHLVLLQNGGCRTLKDKKELEFFYIPEGTF